MSASWSSFRSLVSVLIIRNRAAGSGSEIGRSRFMKESRLPSCPASSSCACRQTGHCTRRSSAIPPTCGSQRRRPPATTASTTSFTVTRSAAPCSIRFSRSSGKLVQATSRAGPMCWSSLVSRPRRSSRRSAAGRLTRTRASRASSCRGLRGRAAGRRGRRLVVLVPEQPGDQPDRAHPIRHRVVDAPDQRDPLAGQRQRVEAPERPRVIEALGEQVADGAAELLVGERIRMIR